MRNRIMHCLVLCLILVVFCAGFVLLLASFSSLAQEPRPTFGSSLDRPTWDEKRKEADEKAKKEQKAQADDVIKVETNLAVFDILVFDKQGRSITGLTGPSNCRSGAP